LAYFFDLSQQPQIVVTVCLFPLFFLSWAQAVWFRLNAHFFHWPDGMKGFFLPRAVLFSLVSLYYFRISFPSLRKSDCLSTFRIRLYDFLRRPPFSRRVWPHVQSHQVHLSKTWRPPHPPDLEGSHSSTPFSPLNRLSPPLD